MADLRVQIPDSAIENFQGKLNARSKPTEITRDALTLYNWAVEEVAKGNEILSANTAGTKFAKLAMESLQSIKPAKPAAE